MSDVVHASERHLTAFFNAHKSELKGERGIQGVQGVQGDRGPQGIQGVKGDKGDDGKSGVLSVSLGGEEKLTPSEETGDVNLSSMFSSSNEFLTSLVESYCPYQANAVTTGATLSAGAISVYTPTASETAATFTLPVPDEGKTADVVVMVDCTDTSPSVSAALPDGKTAIWLDAAEALTYESGFVYQQIYTIVPAEVDDTYYVTFAEQKLTKRAST